MNKVKEVLTEVHAYLQVRENQMYLLFMTLFLGGLLTLGYINDLYYLDGCLRSLPPDEFEQCRVEVEQQREERRSAPVYYIRW